MAKDKDTIIAAINTLAVTEKTVKQLVADCSVDVLDYLHEHGQAQLLNTMLLALTPANLKAVTKFFNTFSGFQYDKEEKAFTKKKKAEHDKDGNVKNDPYANARIAFNEFKEAGGNFWVWWRSQDEAAPNKGEKAKLDLAKLTMTVKTAMKKAKEEGVSNLAVFNAVISDVFTPGDVVAFLAMANKAAPVRQAVANPAAAE